MCGFRISAECSEIVAGTGPHSQHALHAVRSEALVGAPRALQSVTCLCLREADPKLWNNHDREVQRFSRQLMVQDELLGLKMLRRVHEIDPPGDQRYGGVECGLKVEHIRHAVAMWWPSHN